MSTKTKLDTVIRIHGVDVDMSNGVIYEVTNKYDADAPDGFRDNRTTKLLNDEAGRNTISASYDVTTGLWDTGLYAESPMYRGLSAEERNIISAKVKELIVKPFEDLYGEGKLDPRNPNSEFWNYVDKHLSFKVDLYKGRIFRMDNPLERLQLFICIANKDLVPKDKESVPMFRNAQFCVENKEKVNSNKVEESILDTKATGQFYMMLSQPEDLKLILNYIGLNNVDTKNEGMAVTLFQRFINDKSQSYQNKNLFVDAVALYAKPQGKKEIEYYSTIKHLVSKNKVVKVDADYMVGDNPIGANLKSAAKKVAKSPKLQQALDQLLEE